MKLKQCLVPITLVTLIAATVVAPIRAQQTAAIAPLKEEIAQLYRRQDDAFQIRDPRARVKAITGLYTTDFTVTHTGDAPKTQRRLPWIRERASMAFPPTSANEVRPRTLTVSTTVDAIQPTTASTAITVDATENITTSTVTPMDENRVQHGNITMVNGVRDHWVRTTEGWKIQRREIVSQFGKGAVAIEDLTPNGAPDK